VRATAVSVPDRPPLLKGSGPAPPPASAPWGERPTCRGRLVEAPRTGCAGGG